MDNQCSNGEALQELALFAGAGGGILGGHLLGWRTVCAVEWEPYPASVLVARQNEGILPPFPIWDDVQTFDGRPWRGVVDVISGGFPCQDISVAGKGAGIDGERSGMWRHMARIIGEVRPRFVLVENSPALVSRGLARVLSDLASMGYDAKWGVIGADDVGAPHRRKRIWILANSSNIRCHNERKDRRPEIEAESSTLCQSNVADTMPAREWGELWQVKAETNAVGNSDCAQRQRECITVRGKQELPDISNPGWWDVEPGLGRVANGVAHRVDRLKAIGNGQVPSVVKLAWETLSKLD